MSLMTPGQKFGCRHGLLLCAFPVEGRQQCCTLLAAANPGHSGDRRRAPANDEVLASFDFCKQRGQMSLGLTDLYLARHVGCTS